MDILIIFAVVLGSVILSASIVVLAMPFIAHVIGKYWDWADRLLKKDE